MLCRFKCVSTPRRHCKKRGLPCVSDMYYLSFPKDRWTTKFLVYSVFLIDTAQTIIVTNDAFNTYAEHYGQLDALTAIQNEWLAVPVFSGIGEKPFPPALRLSLD